MYPNQPPQAPPPQNPFSQEPLPPQQQMPVDYLNQIAPQAQKKPLFTFGIKQVAVIGAALVILVLILAGVVNSTAGGKTEPLERLSARLTATEKIATDAQINLKSSKLRSLNSNLKLYMTNTNRDVATPLMSAGVDAKKLSTKVVALESTTAMAARLEDARLNAVYDRTYAREMAYQLGTLLTLMNQIYSSTSSTQLKTFLKSSYDNLKPTQESFANFTTTDS